MTTNRVLNHIRLHKSVSYVDLTHTLQLSSDQLHISINTLLALNKITEHKHDYKSAEYTIAEKKPTKPTYGKQTTI